MHPTTATAATITEAIDPGIATVVALSVALLIFILPIASSVVASLSRNLVIFLGTLMLSWGGFLILFLPSPVTVPITVGMQLAGLLLAIGGISRNKNEIERQLQHRISPPIAPLRGSGIGSRFIVKDRSGQKLGYFYYEREADRRSAAKMIGKDEARLIAASVARLPELSRKR